MCCLLLLPLCVSVAGYGIFLCLSYAIKQNRFERRTFQDCNQKFCLLLSCILWAGPAVPALEVHGEDGRSGAWMYRCLINAQVCWHITSVFSKNVMFELVHVDCFCLTLYRWCGQVQAQKTFSLGEEQIIVLLSGFCRNKHGRKLSGNYVRNMLFFCVQMS